MTQPEIPAPWGAARCGFASASVAIAMTKMFTTRSFMVEMPLFEPAAAMVVQAGLHYNTRGHSPIQSTAEARWKRSSSLM